MTPAFWRDKRVLVTGHTGFKGSWLCLWLQRLGAQVIGYSLPPPTHPSLFELAGVGAGIKASVVPGDVRDAAALAAAFAEHRPEIVFHMAALPLVQASYRNPVDTWATNVMGTVHLLEAVRQTPGVRAVVIVTSDKCYLNREWIWPYREDEPLGGKDPYASSKAAAELATAAFRESFFRPDSATPRPPAVASARAGNVIGGGDWSPDRLVPDVMAALFAGEAVALRNIGAIRPWQHVLEALSGYLLLAERLWTHGAAFAEAWNFGPNDGNHQPVADLVERLVELWGGDIAWRPDDRNRPREDRFLKLDSTKARSRLGWKPKLDFDTTLQWIVEWHRAASNGDSSSVRRVTEEQLARYEAMMP